jgi:hypothetical protein
LTAADQTLPQRGPGVGTCSRAHTFDYGNKIGGTRSAICVSEYEIPSSSAQLVVVRYVRVLLEFVKGRDKQVKQITSYEDRLGKEMGQEQSDLFMYD